MTIFALKKIEVCFLYSSHISRISRYLEQQLPAFLAPETGFTVHSFSMDRGRGGGCRIIQVHYISCALDSVVIISAPREIIRY